MTNIILEIFFVSLSIYYFIFLAGIFRGIRRITPTTGSRNYTPFVSVIIPFRNESHNILTSLESLENQSYPKDKFEVIYVNDSSEDDSLKKITDAKKSFNIKVVSVPEDFYQSAHKKRAIKFGLKNSSGEIIVTTDADCTHHIHWLRNMLSAFDSDTGFVSGPVKFVEEDSLFEKLQKLEFSGLVLTGAGLIGIGKPLICNAANIAYRKTAFDSVNGFDDQLNLSSGDDELLMQKIARAKTFKVKFCYNIEAIVLTKGNESLNKFYHQRKRWASKGLFYADKIVILKLVLIFLFYLSLPVQIYLSIFQSWVFVIPALGILVIKYISEYYILRTGINFLFTKKLLNYLPIAEILQIPYIIISGISGAFGNYSWKSRKIKR